MFAKIPPAYTFVADAARADTVPLVWGFQLDSVPSMPIAAKKFRGVEFMLMKFPPAYTVDSEIARAWIMPFVLGFQLDSVPSTSIAAR